MEIDTRIATEVEKLVGVTIKEVKAHAGECGELQALTLITADGQQIVINAPRSHELEVFSR